MTVRFRLAEAIHCPASGGMSDPNRKALFPIGLLCLLALLPAGLDAREVFYRTGHNDLAVDYDPETGWKAYIHDYDTGIERDAFSTVYEITASARQTVPNDPDYAPLGKPGDTVWIIPEIYDPQIIYLGIGAPLLSRNLFAGGLSNRGQISMRLVDVAGSGPAAGGSLSLWQSGFPPRFYFTSADGLGPDDALEAVTANFHAHYNWGFTQPGLYRLTFEFSGQLTPALGGLMTSTRVTYTFQIEHAGNDTPLRYAWALDGGWVWTDWMGFAYTAASPWVYLTETGWWYQPDGLPGDFWAWSSTFGWAWSSQDYYPWRWRVDGGQWMNDAPAIE